MSSTRVPVLAVFYTLVACSHAPARSHTPPEVDEATIAQLQGAMAAGEITSRGLVQHYLDRIARYDKQGPKLNAFLLVNPRALEEADRLDRERATKGPRGQWGLTMDDVGRFYYNYNADLLRGDFVPTQYLSRSAFFTPMVGSNT